MASKNSCLLCLGAFTLSPLLKYKWGRWISFPLFLELCWGFVAPEDVKQRGGDVPMTLWQICCTRAVAPPPLLKVTLLHIWNWVSCLHFCEVKSALNILIFHQNTSCLLPDRGVSICKALHLRESYLHFCFHDGFHFKTRSLVRRKTSTFVIWVRATFPGGFQVPVLHLWGSRNCSIFVSSWISARSATQACPVNNSWTPTIPPQGICFFGGWVNVGNHDTDPQHQWGVKSILNLRTPKCWSRVFPKPSGLGCKQSKFPIPHKIHFPSSTQQNAPGRDLCLWEQDHPEIPLKWFWENVAWVA